MSSDFYGLFIPDDNRHRVGPVVHGDLVDQMETLNDHIRPQQAPRSMPVTKPIVPQYNLST
jgi:hypothetical protein